MINNYKEIPYEYDNIRIYKAKRLFSMYLFLNS